MKLRLEQVGVSRRRKPVLEGVELELASGQFLALLGPNGAGKTTLLRVMLGLQAPDSGRVLVDGTSLLDLSARERAARVAWLPQHSTAGEELCAIDIVSSARYRFDEPFKASERAARQALARVGVADLANRPLSTLSGGERQRVALAGLLAQDAPLLLVDEPANHLDPAQQIDVYRLLGELWRDGRTIICVTHDVNLLRHVGAAGEVRVAGVARGKIAFECTFDSSELPRCLGDLFGVKMRPLALGDARVIVPEVSA